MNAAPASPRPRLAAAELTYRGEDLYELLFTALGSQCQLLLRGAEAAAARHLQHEAGKWIESFEARFSRFRADSLLSRINRGAGMGWVEIDPDTEVLLDLAGHCHFVTGGAFDATSLPLTLLWDWKREHARVPVEEEIAHAKSRMGWARVQRRPGSVSLPAGMMLDFGGIGKEFAADCLRQLAISAGLKGALIDLGGDLAAHGDAPEGDGWYVGLENPDDLRSCYGGIRLRGGAAVATSGNYRRCFELAGRRYGHILDCRTGWPVANGTRVVTVVAPRCTLAGLLSTSAVILGGQAAIAMLERTAGVEGCLWRDQQLFETRGFRRALMPAGLAA